MCARSSSLQVERIFQGRSKYFRVALKNQFRAERILWGSKFNVTCHVARECKTWTVDYGLVHGLDHGPCPYKKTVLLMLVLITTCLSVWWHALPGFAAASVTNTALSGEVKGHVYLASKLKYSNLPLYYYFCLIWKIFYASIQYCRQLLAM